jgi:hypothetical protein
VEYAGQRGSGLHDATPRPSRLELTVVRPGDTDCTVVTSEKVTGGMERREELVRLQFLSEIPSARKLSRDKLPSMPVGTAHQILTLNA